MVRGKKPRERPLKNYDGVKELFEGVGLDWEQAYDKKRWKEAVLVAKSFNSS